MTKSTNPNTLYAFVAYDQFPFVLGTPGELLPNGNFKSAKYQGTYPRSAIIAIYPVELGEEMLKKIEKEYIDYEDEKRVLLLKHLGNVKNILPELHAYRAGKGNKPN